MLDCVCAAMCTCVCAAPGDGVMPCVCARVFHCVHVCNPFILTVSVLSGERKEAGENKRPMLDSPFYNSEPAPHPW